MIKELAAEVSTDTDTDNEKKPMNSWTQSEKENSKKSMEWKL